MAASSPRYAGPVPRCPESPDDAPPELSDEQLKVPTSELYAAALEAAWEELAPSASSSSSDKGDKGDKARPTPARVEQLEPHPSSPSRPRPHHSGPYASERAALDWSYHVVPSPSRQALQDQIVRRVLDQQVRECAEAGDDEPCRVTGGCGELKEGRNDAGGEERPLALFTAGGMGAGKGHTLREMLKTRRIQLPANTVWIDPDALSRLLPERPSYLSSNPSTASALLHPEASLLQEICAAVARGQKRSLVVDGSLTDCAWFEGFMREYRRAGYDCEILFVSAPEKVMLERAEKRAKTTGRVTNPDAIKTSRIKSPECVTALSKPGLVRRVRLIDNSSDSSSPLASGPSLLYDSSLDPLWPGNSPTSLHPRAHDSHGGCSCGSAGEAREERSAEQGGWVDAKGFVEGRLVQGEDGRQTPIMAEPVELFVYDLSGGMASVYGPMLVGRPLEGIWHTAIVLYGMEIFYGQGISIVSPPGTTHHGTPKKRITLGHTHLDKETVLDYVESLRETYTADAYHLLSFNCNVFTNDVAGFVIGTSIPAEILNQARDLISTPFGQQMRPMIEQMFVGRRTPSAGAAVNNLLPSLGVAPPASAPSSATATGTTTPVAVPRDTPTTQSLTSNLQICTAAASLRSTLTSAPAVAVMFTSPTCPPCTAIKPFFEDLARKHGGAAGSKRIEFVLVEMGIGEGAQVARSAEFGGPVQATPSFVFFARGEKVGECKGADRRELETQVQLLEMAAFPAHPHTRLALPALEKLARNLAPVTYTAFPPLTALSEKISAATALNATTLETFSKVVSYLSTLPAPPAPALTAPFPSDLLTPWLSSTLAALSTLPSSPSSAPLKFPIVDLIRLALARDLSRLAAQPAFVAFLPTLVARLASDLDTDAPPRAYLLTALRVVSNALPSPVLAARLLAPDALPALTRLVLRALLDPEDEKLRAAGAGLAWSVVARVYAARTGLDGAAVGVEEGKEHALGGESESGGEEWEAEVASAVVEALGKETQSVEVVHRLTATLALLLYQSPYFSEVGALLEVLETKSVIAQRRETVSASAVAEKEKADVLGVLRDLERLLDEGQQ
ncbi:hypothetical protein JCM10207_006394 [Rhodosporidiobolus poonsookiae]